MKRAIFVTRVARRSGILRVLHELGVVGSRPATREGAEEFRQALEELGTTYIKLGQLLSSRPDLLPDVYIEELGKLVDQVPPVPFAEIQRAIGEDLPADTFARIDPEPVATASIAQIHSALLKTGREVIVKVRRPGIEEQVEVDFALLRSTAETLERRSERAQLLQARALADELEVHLRAELDLTEEANNTELVAGMLEEWRDIVVPQVIRPYVTERVLVLERIDGRKVDDDHGLAAERAQNLARQFFRAYVHQVTVEGVYHADPHRGNVLLTSDGRLALVDFGLLGRLDDDTRRSLSLLLLAVAQNRADDVADLILGLSLTSLASDEADRDFAPEPMRREDLRHWMQTLLAELDRTIEVARTAVPRMQSRRAALAARIERLGEIEPSGVRIRQHGDLHLGQVLRSAGEWLVFDFEGEPARPLSERRAKHSPLRDVAGMLRSFAYAAATANRPQAAAPLRDAFLDGWRSKARDLLPRDQRSASVLLDSLELEKLLYELRYEIGHRPDWVSIPARELLEDS